MVYPDLSKAIAAEKPDTVVIANETGQHHGTLAKLAELGYTKTVLVEKPLFNCSQAFVPRSFQNVFVAYNLRFHPVIQRLKTLLRGEDIISVQAYAGQYLPDWRPGSDYRGSYSASAEQGGGVLRDLSHELDYLTWMLGGWERVAALGGHMSRLDISSDDVFALMLVTCSCPIVTLQMNYLDRLARRNLIINTEKHTIEADLIKGVITMDREIESFATGRDDTYRAMHEAVFAGSFDMLCTLDEGVEIVRLIEAAERAAKNREWVTQ